VLSRRTGVKPELARPLAVADIPAGGWPAGGRSVHVEASEEERAALARRLRIPGIEALACDFTLRRAPRGAIEAAGRLAARVVQTCVVTAEDFSAEMEEEFSVRFVPAGGGAVDFDPEAPDEIPYEDGTLDLGEATAEQLALALDPWPRRPDAG
jgi:hypothetical protein